MTYLDSDCMGVYETIKERRTIRRFVQKEVEKEILFDCMNAARLAPSGSNLQPLEYVIVTKDRDRVFSNIKLAAYLKDWMPAEDEKPMVYIVIISNAGINKAAKYDAGLAAGNIILTALGNGVAGCIIANINREALGKELEIPENYVIELVVALGYPAQESFEEELRNDLKYWLDEKGNLHVPKRKITDVVHEEKF